MATAVNTDRTVRDTIVGVFHSHAEAQRAVSDLKAAGFTDDQIGVASRDKEGTFAEQNEETMAEEGAVAGAATGLGAGALWGLGIVAGALPAIGPVIAGGALAAVAASAAGTAAAGGLIGALVGWGIPEEEANYYHNEFEQGRTIVTVKCGESRWEEAHRILDQVNAYDYHRRETEHAADPSAAQRYTYSGEVTDRRTFDDTARGDVTGKVDPLTGVDSASRNRPR